MGPIIEHLFEREYTQLSRLFGEVMDFMSREHGHLLSDNLAYWEPLFETMARHVEMKGKTGVFLPPPKTLAGLFLD